MARRDTDYKLKSPVNLKVGCVYLKTFYRENGMKMVRTARDMLWDHNLHMDVYPYAGEKKLSNTMDYGDRVIPDKTEEYEKLYKAAKKKLREAGCQYVNPLVVVFCQFQNLAYGIAPKLGSKADRLCLIAPHATEPGTLIHELGHAADLHHDSTNKTTRNIMDTIGPRKTIYRYQVEAIRKSYFSVGN